MDQINALDVAKENSVFDELTRLGHEQLVFCQDEDTGLKALIGIHNTVLGPAMGGTRMWQYANDNEAVLDVLRLSRGMTFKNALAGLDAGGGKAVIIGDPKKLKNEALLRRFGKFVESLNGKYVTAEDVSMSTKDMEYISMETRHVTGLSKEMGGLGDPSPVTAYGTYMGMKAAAKKVYGSDKLDGKKIAVQGVGSVGGYLLEYLAKEGAELFIADINEGRLQEINKKHGAQIVDLDAIYDVDMDIYAPCALGGTLNDDTIPRLKCSIVAGAANNQLKNEERHGRQLIDRNIVYAPDFLINAGGVINVYLEYNGISDDKMAYNKAEGIYDTCLSILNKAQDEDITSQEAAMQLAMNRINQVGK